MMVVPSAGPMTQLSRNRLAVLSSAVRIEALELATAAHGKDAAGRSLLRELAA
jgi:hypothetical protein